MQEFIMAASRVVQARVPGDIQDAASQVIRASGLTVSDVVRVLITRIAQDNEIPAALFQPNAETLHASAEVERGGLERCASGDERFTDLPAADCAHHGVSPGLQARGERAAPQCAGYRFAADYRGAGYGCAAGSAAPGSCLDRQLEGLSGLPCKARPGVDLPAH